MRKSQLKIWKKSMPGFHGNGKGKGYKISVLEEPGVRPERLQQ